MGLTFDDDSRFSQQVFDKYTTKLEHKEEQAHRNMAKISDKLQFNREDIGKAVFNKSTLVFHEEHLGQAVAGQGKPSILMMSDEAFEIEKNRIITDMVEKNPKTKINSAAVQKKIRKQIAEKYGAKFIKTESDLMDAKIRLKKRAASQTENMQGRLRIAGTAVRGVSHVISEQGGAREKDTGTETLIKANRYTRRFRRELVYMAFTPDTVMRIQRLSKLERKQSKLVEKRNDRIMQEFFNNAHQNEAAVMHGLFKTENARVEGLAVQSKRMAGYTGKVKDASKIAEHTEKNRAVIQKEMQKKSNRKKYRKAVAGNGSSAAIKTERKLLFSRTSLFSRFKTGAKNLWLKLLTGCLIPLLIGLGVMACVFLILGLLFTNIFSSSNETTSWTNVTAMINDFTKKETDYVPDILASNEPITTDVTIDDYEWYVVIDGEETEVDSEISILDRWNESGQADQNKLIAFICTLQVDAALENSEGIINDVLEKMYSLSIEVEERTTETDGCGCGCQSNPPAECGCSDCEGSGSTETTRVQVTKFTMNDLDKVIDELYSRYVSPEKKEQLISYYNTYQVTRGGNVSLGNPLPYHWYSGFTPPSSYSGWRFIDRGDGNGYTVELHNGLDIPAWEGVKLFMPFDGTIYEAGYDDSRGNYVIMLSREGNAKVTYMHMNSHLTETGDSKKRAYGVGSVGSTGDSTGPHLHVEIQVKDESGNWVYVNPLFVFTEELVYKNSYGDGTGE